MHHRRDIDDASDITDNVNTVCEHCERPELFCACPEDVKRTLDGFDQNP